MSMKFAAFVDDSVSVDGGLYTETRIEIHAFGERVAYKRSGDDFRTAGGLGAVPWGVPPEALGILAGLAFAGLLAWSANQGALVLVIQRPGYAGVSAALVVVLVLGPFPGVPVSRAGGGGEANFYWELTDPLGTGMVMLDETGARKLHRTYTPFGVEHASAGAATWLPRHYAGHLADEDSGLVYMQARWMDPESGTFLSVDPVVADAADPQAFNAYAYARNNPVSYIDPTGESCFSIPLFGGTICMGYEGGYFPGPNGFVESGYSGPGPSAAPVDSVGSLLSSLMNLGGSETPRSQGDFRPTGTFISQISGAIDEGEVGLFEVTEHVEDLALKNRGLDTFDIELRIKNKGDSPADVLVQTFETQDRFSNAGTRIEPSGRLVNIRDISPDETRMIRVPLPRRPDMPRPMYPNQRLFFAVRPSGGPVSLDARVVARGVSL